MAKKKAAKKTAKKAAKKTAKKTTKKKSGGKKASARAAAPEVREEGFAVEETATVGAEQNTDIVELILADHGPLKALIETLKSEDASLDEKKEAFESFAPLLVAHAKPEEQSLYVSMKENEETKTEGIEGDIEHELADRLCEELKTETDDDVFEAKVKVLAELVEHHIEEEEEEMLPTFREESETSEREEIGRRYLELRAEFIPAQGAKPTKGKGKNQNREALM